MAGWNYKGSILTAILPQNLFRAYYFHSILLVCQLIEFTDKGLYCRSR